MRDHPENSVKNGGGNQQAEQLLEIVGRLADELNPHRSPTPLTLDSSLDRKYGFDSLSRVELMLRIERAFDISLPEQLLALAETPRDLLREMGGAPPSPNLIR